MKSLRVALRLNPYSVVFGETNESFLSAFRKLRLRPSRVFLLTTRGVGRTKFPKIIERQFSRIKIPVGTVQIPNGEDVKNLNTLETLYHEALRQGLNRRGLVAAVGGGVVTDLGGFFASTYLRGVPYINIPTSLLGMVDASIGGKTGVDLPEGKNLVGAFSQPKLVWIDTGVLKTLPSREWKTGFAEVIKYGVIRSRPFFHWLEEELRANANVKKWEPSRLFKAIYQCASIKAKVVSRDERETPLKGGREILNFGHTIGHALEAATLYGRLTHGEAISVGMVAAGVIALNRRWWSEDEQLQLLLIFQVLNLPTQCPVLTREEKKLFWSALLSDKKNVSENFRFVLTKRMGEARVVNDISKAEIEKALKAVGF